MLRINTHEITTNQASLLRQVDEHPTAFCAGWLLSRRRLADPILVDQ